MVGGTCPDGRHLHMQSCDGGQRQAPNAVRCMSIRSVIYLPPRTLLPSSLLFCSGLSTQHRSDRRSAHARADSRANEICHRDRADGLAATAVTIAVSAQILARAQHYALGAAAPEAAARANPQDGSLS